MDTGTGTAMATRLEVGMDMASLTTSGSEAGPAWMSTNTRKSGTAMARAWYRHSVARQGGFRISYIRQITTITIIISLQRRGVIQADLRISAPGVGQQLGRGQQGRWGRLVPALLLRLLLWWGAAMVWCWERAPTLPRQVVAGVGLVLLEVVE